MKTFYMSGRLDETAIRADQSRKEWYKYFSKGFISDTVEIKKTHVKDALEHLQLSGSYATRGTLRFMRIYNVKEYTRFYAN